MGFERQHGAHVAIKEHTNLLNVQNISFGPPPGAGSFDEYEAVHLNWAKPSEADIAPYGERSYAISPIIHSEHVKSDSFDSCFGIVMTGRNAEGEGVVRLIHAYPSYILADTERTERFTRDLLHATREFNAACKKYSMDVTIMCGWNPASTIHDRAGKRFGGEERRLRNFARLQYEKMLELFRENFDAELTFSPTVIVGKHHVPGNVRVYATAPRDTHPQVYIEDSRLQDTKPVSAAEYATCRLADVADVLKKM